jgi:hypothetical protein
LGAIFNSATILYFRSKIWKNLKIGINFLANFERYHVQFWWNFQGLCTHAAHTKKVGKKQLLLSCQIVHFSGIENFISQRCKMIATKWKWDEHKFDMNKFQSWGVGALVLWRAFGLTEISQTFCYENWQILKNESVCILLF